MTSVEVLAGGAGEQHLQELRGHLHADDPAAQTRTRQNSSDARDRPTHPRRPAARLVGRAAVRAARGAAGPGHPAPHDSSQLAARVVVKASVLRALDGLDALELAVLQAIVQDTEPALLAASADAVERALRAAAHAGTGLGLARPPRPRRARDAAAAGRPAGRRGARRCSSKVDGPGAGDPRPPRRHRCGRPLERGRRADRRPGRRSGCWRTSTSATCGCPGRCASCSTPQAGRRIDEPPALATSERGQATGRPGRRRRRVRAGTTDRAAPGPLGHPSPAGAEGRRARRTRAARGRRPPPRRAGRRRARHRDRRRGGPARPGHDRRRGRGLAADRGATTPGWSRRRPQRWTTLARAWAASPRLVSAIGGRIGDKPVNALSPDLPRSWLVGLRNDVLAELTELPADQALAPGTGVSSLVQTAALEATAATRWRASTRWPPCWRRRRCSGSPGWTRCRPSAACSSTGERPVERPREAAAGPGRPRPAPGRPHRDRAGSARAGARAQAVAGRRRRVARRGDGLPVRGLVRTTRLRRRLVGSGGARLRLVDLADPRPPVADLPRRRRLPPLRHPARRARRVVPAQRRRDRAHRAGPRAGSRVAAPASDRADGGGLRRPARHAAPADPRARTGPRRRGRRRHRPGGPARRLPCPDLTPTHVRRAPGRAPPPAPPRSSRRSGSATGRPARDRCAGPAHPPRPT